MAEDQVAYVVGNSYLVTTVGGALLSLIRRYVEQQKNR